MKPTLFPAPAGLLLFGQLVPRSPFFLLLDWLQLSDFIPLYAGMVFLEGR